MTRARTFMGRRVIRSSVRHGGSQTALRGDFNASMAEVLGNLNEFVQHMEDVSADVLVEVLEPTFDKSQEYTPVMDGTLKDSGYLESRKFRGKSEAEVGYGRSGKPDYAIYVHEIPASHTAPTRDKFLQTAFEEDYFSIVGRIPEVLRRVAGT